MLHHTTRDNSMKWFDRSQVDSTQYVVGHDRGGECRAPAGEHQMDVEAACEPAAQRAAVEVRQSRPVIATPEEQISQLQDQVKELKARLAALEKKFAQHRHEVPVTEVGMLSEPINGRRVSLAISPRSGKGKSGPPVE